MLPPDAYEAWLRAPTRDASGDDDLLTEGRRVAEKRECVACHTVTGASHVGPTWVALYGSRVKLDDGRIVVADDAYLTRSMMEPNVEVVAGYKSVMPTYFGVLRRPRSPRSSSTSSRCASPRRPASSSRSSASRPSKRATPARAASTRPHCPRGTCHDDRRGFPGTKSSAPIAPSRATSASRAPSGRGSSRPITSASASSTSSRSPSFSSLGGLFAMLLRIEHLTPGPTIVSAMAYNRLFTLHGITWCGSS